MLSVYSSKVAPTSFELKHYQNGEFHKDYDRAVTLKSIVNFLKDPKGKLGCRYPLEFTLFLPCDSNPGTLKRKKKKQIA